METTLAGNYIYVVRGPATHSVIQCNAWFFLLLARTGFEPRARNSEMMRRPGWLCVIVDQRPHYITTVLDQQDTKHTRTTGINAEFKDFMPCLFITKEDMLPRSGLGLCVN